MRAPLFVLAEAAVSADSPISQLAPRLGPNDLPYSLPIHPNLVHFTIGLFVIAIAFDIAGALYPVEKRVFRFLALPVTREGFHDVGWYNLLSCAVVSFFTVAAGFFEMLLAVPIAGVKSTIGLESMETMLWHGVGGVAILLAIVAMTIWRGYQRFVWRKDMGRQVQWLYLLVAMGMFLVIGLHGTLGAELAAEFGLNVVIHQRDAWDDTLEILKNYTGRLRGVFHCFGNTPDQAKEILALGHLVSFTGIVTFKNAGLVRDVVAAIPPDSFMVETDCPYLAPVPHRGKRCEPAHTLLVAEKIAELRGTTLEEIAATTTRTAEHFFRLGAR